MASKPEMDTTLLDDTVTFDSDPFPALLDARILRALADLSFTHPTLVQTQAIPLILQGKDVLAKARTGSGKTAAYGLPAVQRVLVAKEVCGFAMFSFRHEHADLNNVIVAARSREQDPVSNTGTYQRVGPASDNVLQERDEILRGFS